MSKKSVKKSPEVAAKSTAKKVLEKNTQLTVPEDDFDTKRLIFSDIIMGKVPDSDIPTKRINISVQNTDGTVGDLILLTPRVFSFGVSEFEDKKTHDKSYSMGLSLWSRDGVKPEEKTFSDTIIKIVEAIKKHIVSVREDLGQDELTIEELRPLNPLKYRKDKATGKVIKDAGPTINPNILVNKKSGKVSTMFFDMNDDPIEEPLTTLLKAYCYVTAGVKIDSIFFGAKTSIQVKLYEAKVEMVGSAVKPLISRPKTAGKLIVGKKSAMKSSLPEDDQDDDDEKESSPVKSKPRKGSIEDDDEDEPVDDDEPTPPPAPKKTVKRVVKK